MKKSISILVAFCLGLFISVSVIACATDSERTGNTNITNDNKYLNIKSVSMDEGDGIRYLAASIEYDELGRFDKLWLDEGEDSFYVLYKDCTIILSGPGGEYSVYIECDDMVGTYSAIEFNQTIINALALMSLG